MKFVHILNAVLWMMNVFCWALIAHSLLFTFASLGVVAVSVALAYQANNDYWGAVVKRERRAVR